MSERILRGEDFPVEDLQVFISFVQIYVDQFHHGKEEKILFPIVHDLGVIKSGGPRCTYFYPLFLQDRYLEQAKKEILNYQNIKPYVIKEQLKPIYDMQSPLVIPLEDHEVGYYLIQLMDREIKRKLLEESDWDSKKLFKFFTRYLDMIYMHIRKEDECLFMVLKKEISNDLKNDITKKSEILNSELETDVYMVLEAVKELEKKYIKIA